MSIDYSIYLGPYVEFRAPLVEETSSCCQKQAQSTDRKTPFCPHCGMAASFRCRKVWRPQHCPDLDSPELRDVLIEVETQDGPESVFRLLPNRSYPGMIHKGWLDIHEEGAIDLLSRDRADECKAFLDAHREVLRTLTQQMGREPLACWGLVKWSS